MAVTFPASSASPFTDPNGTVWVWNGQAWQRRPVSLAAFAGAVWEPATAYAQRTAVTNQWGELVTATVAHTSGSSYDATKWFTPGSPDGGTVVDFTRLADGALTTVRPVYGQISSFPSTSEDYSVINGRLVSNELWTSGPLYFQTVAREVIQHAWAVVEVSDTPATATGFLILLTNGEWFSGNLDVNRAAVHTQVVAKPTAESVVSGVTGGPFVVPGSPITANRGLPYSLAGRTFRYDVTADKLTGEIRYYIDGVMVLNYVDPALIGYTSRFAIAELEGPTFKVLQFGTSPVLPLVAPDQPAHAAGAFSSANNLTSSWQLVRTIRVKYGRSGQALIEWAPFISCTQGVVHLAMGPSAAGEPTSAAFYHRVCDATTRARVPYREVRLGSAGTTESVGIYARTAGAGAVARIESSDFGGNGPTSTMVVSDNVTAP